MELAERGLRNGAWWLAPADPIGVRELLATPRVLVAFDAPIGLPKDCAPVRGTVDFPSFPAGLSDGEPFFEPAASPNEVRLARPFYPRRAGCARRVHPLGSACVNRGSSTASAIGSPAPALCSGRWGPNNAAGPRSRCGASSCARPVPAWRSGPSTGLWPCSRERGGRSSRKPVRASPTASWACRASPRPERPIVRG